MTKSMWAGAAAVAAVPLAVGVGLVIAPAAQALQGATVPTDVVAAPTTSASPAPSVTAAASVSPTPTPTPTRTWTRTPSPTATPTPTVTPTVSVSASATATSSAPASTPASTPAASYSLIDVSAHSTSGDCWSAVSGSVYNLTAWGPRHPGGQSVITGMCGGDGTSAFLSRHSNSSKAKAALVPYLIGTYTGGPAPSASPVPSGTPTYPLTTVATHNSASSCWVAVSGNIYDLTAFRTTHSGGATVITNLCGKDGSATFNGQHSGTATAKQNILAKYLVGVLSGGSTTTPVTTPTASYSASQLATHSSAADCWVAVSGNVYDLTAFRTTHSGGSAVITALCGKDGTSTFTGQHSNSATAKKSVLASYLKGTYTAGSVTTPTSSYTLADIAKHASASDCWSGVAGTVYNLTNWIAAHPGGPAPVIAMCGTDGTTAFYMKHSSSATAIGALAPFKIGTQSDYVPRALPTAPTVEALAGGGEYTMDEVALHNSAADCWSVISGGVYGLSTWIPVHPGGAGTITPMCGADGTAAFLGKHSSGSAGSILAKLRMGTLVSQKSVVFGKFSLADVATHNTASDCWSVVDDTVYNLTSWVGQHPGGPDVIVAMCGIDGSAMYNGKHGGSASIKSSLDLLKVGDLLAGGADAAAAGASAKGAAALTVYSTKQVRRHSTAGNCWTVVNGMVYNLTPWTKKHADREETIEHLCGRNGTKWYVATHGGAKKSARLLKKYLIGKTGVVAPTSTAPAVASAKYSMADVAAHATPTSCWSVVSGSVYDLTAWIDKHPGGAGVIKAMCGKDGTASFQGMHGSSASAKKSLVPMMLGVIG